VKVVVTGATGNVGTSVMRRLSADPGIDHVVGLARRVPAATEPGVTWQSVDVAGGDLDTSFAGADAVVHLAWVIQPNRDRAFLRRVNEEGSRRVAEAVVRNRVPALVYASSVGTYSYGPKDRPVDESWSTAGIDGSLYSRQKSAVEALLDQVESDHRELRVVRLRTALVFQRQAAAEIHRYFIGRAVPMRLLRRSLIPVVPHHPRLVFQVVHAGPV
jgi:UDP-glucose 4-epimerase